MRFCDCGKVIIGKSAFCGSVKYKYGCSFERYKTHTTSHTVKGSMYHEALAKAYGNQFSQKLERSKREGTDFINSPKYLKTVYGL
jgi:hypothetical protein